MIKHEKPKNNFTNFTENKLFIEFIIARWYNEHIIPEITKIKLLDDKLRTGEFISSKYKRLLIILEKLFVEKNTLSSVYFNRYIAIV